MLKYILGFGSKQKHKVIIAIIYYLLCLIPLIRGFGFTALIAITLPFIILNGYNFYKKKDKGAIVAFSLSLFLLISSILGTIYNSQQVAYEKTKHEEDTGEKLARMIAYGVDYNAIENEMEKHGIFLLNTVDADTPVQTSSDDGLILISPTIWHDSSADEWIVVGGGYWQNNNWKSHVNWWEWFIGGNLIEVGGRDAIGIVFSDTDSNEDLSKILRLECSLYLSDDNGWSRYSNRMPFPGRSTVATIIEFQPGIYDSTNHLLFMDKNNWKYRANRFSIYIRFNSDFENFTGTAKTVYAHTWGNTGISYIRVGGVYVNSSKHENYFQVGDSVEIGLSGNKGWVISSKNED